MKRIELRRVDCRDLSGLSGIDIQKTFESADRFVLLAVSYPGQSFRTVLILSPKGRVLRFFKPAYSAPIGDAQRSFRLDSGAEIERDLSSIGIREKSLAPISGAIEDTIFENEEWPLPVSIREHDVPESMVDEFIDYFSTWLSQLSDWLALNVIVEEVPTSAWYYAEVKKFLADERLKAFGALWKLVPGEGWFESDDVCEAILREIASLRNGDDSIRSKLQQSLVFAQRDQDRSALISSVLPSKRLVCQLRPGQSIGELMERFDETLLLRAQLIAELNSPLSYFFAKEIIEGAEKSIQLSRVHAGEAVNESVQLLKSYRARQDEMYPILTLTLGGVRGESS